MPQLYITMLLRLFLLDLILKFCINFELQRLSTYPEVLIGSVQTLYIANDILRCARICQHDTACIGMTYNDTDLICKVVVRNDNITINVDHPRNLYRRNKECKLQEYTYVWQTDACIKIVTYPRYNWTTAKEFCEFEEGNLLILDSAGKESVLKPLVVEAYVKTECNSFWLGCTEDEDNIFKWVDGKALTYSNWELGQPDNKDGSTDCLRYHFKESMEPKWYDRRCDDSFGFICENTNFA